MQTNEHCNFISQNVFYVYLYNLKAKTDVKQVVKSSVTFLWAALLFKIHFTQR